MKLLWFLIGFALGIIAVGLCLDNMPESSTTVPEVSREEKIDTIRDTIKIPEPEFVDRLKVRMDTVWLPMVAEAHDSIHVQIPIEQKVYADSTYKAWVSGFNPALDSIEVYPVNIERIIHTTETRYRNRRWGLGVTAGVGITPQNVQPYIGFGISYNIFSW